MDESNGQRVKLGVMNWSM